MITRCFSGSTLKLRHGKWLHPFLLQKGLFYLILQLFYLQAIASPPGRTAGPSVIESDTTGKQEPAAGRNIPKGLRVDFYNGINFEQYVFSRADDQVKYQWAHPVYAQGLEGLEFSARWTGRLSAPEDGMYRIVLRVDDGARLWLGGKLVIDKWYRISGESITLNTKPVSYTAEVKLKGGSYYSLKIDYFNYLGPGTIKLYWEPPYYETSSFFGLVTSRQRELIPQEYLSLPPPEPDSKPAASQPVARQPVKKPADSRKVPVSADGTATAKTSIPAPPLIATGNRKEPEPVQQQNFEHVEEGKAIVLSHVLFEQSRYVLLPDSYEQLDKLVQALHKNPDMQIEISGHTENVGEARLNQALSEQRAQVVASYLIRKGIGEERVTAKGYGGSRPVAGNATEAERARNRRVEFTIRRKEI
jgi:outer membrane protein OmpA-like peptidoglycan-associated protein